MGETTLGPELGRLIEAAKGAAGFAYAPYSGFAVGAAVLGGSGAVHVGCNVENASYPGGPVRRAGRVGAAIAAGEERLVAVAVAGRGRAWRLWCRAGSACSSWRARRGTDRREQATRPVGRPAVSALLPLAFSLPESP